MGRKNLLFLILVHEALDASFCVQKLVLTGIEGVTVGANFDFDVVFCGSSFDHIATGTFDGRF